MKASAKFAEMMRNGPGTPRITKTNIIFCKHCGIEFENGECPLCGAKQEEAVKYSDKICTNCFNAIDEYSNFCPFCGKHIINKSPKNNIPASSEEDIPDPNTVLWFILGFLQLVVCCNPFGIGTLICVHKANKLANEGKMKAANKKIRAAKIWFFVGCSIVAVQCAIFFITAGL